jgi:hypothetical protein
LQLDKFIFEQSTSFRHPQKIHNVVPGDFNNDGRLDLLVMSQGQDPDESAMAVYFSDLQGGFGAYFCVMLAAWVINRSLSFTNPNTFFVKPTANRD